jgi:MATE family multidrug resistance protein
LRAELRDTLKLAGPIVLSQVGHMSMGLVDTLVAGRIGTETLAGLGLASNFYWTFTSVCIGCLLSLDTFFAQAVGARDEGGLARYFKQSFWSCGFVTILSAVAIAAAYFLYLGFASPSATRHACAVYLENIIWSLPSLFLFFVLQRYWQARHRVLPFMVIIIGANVLNLLACLALGLGMWNFPRLEVQGIAYATVICRYVMLLAAVVFTWRELKPAAYKLPRVDWAAQRDIFRLGLPAAGHTGLEVGAFGLATVFVSVLGAVPLAAHHVCLMMSAFTFMFPLGFSSAAAVRVGFFLGAGQPARARLAGWLCIGLSVAVMSGFALCYLTVPRTMLGWFTHDPAVIEAGVKILLLVALFQIGDGIQVSTTGALRGIGNTRAAMFANLIGHYPVGIALGLGLCFGLNFGVVGMWVGLAAGLISVATMLLFTWVRKTRDVSRLKPLATAGEAPA